MVKNSLNDIGKGASIIILGIIIANILSLTNQILLGRFLGPSNYGLFSLGISILITLSIIPQLGLGAGLTQYIPYNLKKNNYGKIKESINFVILFTFILGVAVGIILFLFSEDISIIFNNDTKLSYILKIFAICMPFCALFYNLSFLTRAFKKPKFYVYIENITFPILQIIVFLVLYSIGYGLLGAVIGVTLASIIVAAIYVFLAKFKFCKMNTNYYTDKSLVRKEILSISLPLFFAGFSFLFMQYADKIILGIYMSPFDVGVYSAAFTIAGVLLFVYTAFSFNFRPVLAAYFALNDFNSIKKIYSIVTKWIFMITLPLLIYMIFFSKDIMNLIFGQMFVSGYLALSILAIGISFNGLTGLSGESLIAMKHPKLNLYSELIGAASNVLLNLTLIPIFGILGAAIGTSLSLIFRNLSSLGFLKRKVNFNPYNLDFLKIILASIISFSISISIFNFLGKMNFLLSLPIFIMFYILILILIGGLDQNDKFFIKKSFFYIKNFIK